MMVDSYIFLQIPTVTSHFPAKHKAWLPRQLLSLCTMAKSEESVPIIITRIDLIIVLPINQLVRGIHFKVSCFILHLTITEGGLVSKT